MGRWFVSDPYEAQPEKVESVQRKNKCPTDKPCKLFTEIFGDAQSFCQNVWGGSWKVVPDTQSCINLNFQGANPNAPVARKRAIELINGQPNGQINLRIEICVMLVTFITYLVL